MTTFIERFRGTLPARPLPDYVAAGHLNSRHLGKRITVKQNGSWVSFALRRFDHHGGETSLWSDVAVEVTVPDDMVLTVVSTGPTP